MGSSSEESDEEKYWINWFLSLRGNEFFCEVDYDYIADRFNLTYLNVEVQYYNYALRLILDQMSEELDESVRLDVEKAARNLYGLIHARFIMTSRGLGKMMEKYNKADFGKCPRVYCQGQPMLPLGMTDTPYQKAVKLYCPKCEDVYSPRSSRHQYVDGAFFGTSFPHMFLQVHPISLPNRSSDRYIPKMFGFRIHEVSKLLSDPPSDLKPSVCTDLITPVTGSQNALNNEEMDTQ